MKRLAFAFSLVAATAFAAPLAAQGPWYDPNGTGQRTDQGRVDRNGTVYNDGVYRGNGRYDVPTDGRWHRMGTDRQGRTIYVRERYDSNGNLIQEAATRNVIGQYNIIDRRVVSLARNNRDGRYDRVNGRDRNDRWDLNRGHDNGKHKGKYKNNDRYDDRYDRERQKYEQERQRNLQKYEQAQRKTEQKYQKKIQQQSRKH
jgi:hypothetical protein